MLFNIYLYKDNRYLISRTPHLLVDLSHRQIQTDDLVVH